VANELNSLPKSSSMIETNRTMNPYGHVYAAFKGPTQDRLVDMWDAASAGDIDLLLSRVTT
jgi:hypothetical protein